MTFKSKRKKKIEKLLNKSKVVTIDDLKNTLNTDFSKTIFRYLKEIGYLTSYNNAGRFYTMPHIPKFDEYGLWHYEVASFSKFGTLKSTICSMIESSHEGFTHRELKQLLRCRVQNTLNDLTKNNVISRVSVNGLFVYISANKEKALAQISQREKRSGIKKSQGEAIELPIVIEILLELLRSSVWDAKTITRNLHVRRISVTEQQVKEVFLRYNLKKNS
jgi:ribosomal protein S25